MSMGIGKNKSALLIEFGAIRISAGETVHLKQSQDFIKIFDKLRVAIEEFEEIEGRSEYIDSAVNRMIEERMEHLRQVSTILKRKWDEGK